MTRALITGAQPLYRLAVTELMGHHRSLYWDEASDPLGPSEEALNQVDLLVICAGTDDAELIRQLGSAPRRRPAKILLFSEYLGKRHQALLELGRIDLCLPLSISRERARDYLERLLALPRGRVIQEALNDPRIRDHFCPDLRDLTRSERKVLFNLQQGLSNQAIADRMNICLNTVKVHLARACRKAGFRNRYQAAGFTSTLLTVDGSFIRGGL